MLKGIVLAIVLGIVGMAVGYISGLSHLPSGGQFASAAVGALMGLVVSWALWITRHGDAGVVQIGFNDEEELSVGQREEGPVS